jgi:hypothetical protein
MNAQRTRTFVYGVVFGLLANVVLFAACSSPRAPDSGSTPAPGVAQATSAQTPPASTAASHPDFTGAWKLNYDKCKWGNFPIKDRFSQTRVIRQAGDKLTVTVAELDGSGKETGRNEYEFEVPSKGLNIHKTDLVSSLLWFRQTQSDKDSVLAVGEYALVWDMRLKDGTAALNETWTLSKDGRVLTIGNALMGGVFKNWYVFDKQ